jgi:cytosine/creatinine deaminase
MCQAGHLGTRDEIKSSFDMITYNPARGMRLEHYGVEEGNNADLVLDAADVHEALRLQPDRVAVIKGGKVVAESKTERKLLF